MQSDYLFGSFLQLSAFLQRKRYSTAVGTHLRNYKEVREYFEKEHPKGTTREASNERLLKSHGSFGFEILEPRPSDSGWAGICGFADGLSRFDLSPVG